MSNFRIVLVEPGESRNIGSVLRAMSNFGFEDIALVAPRSFEEERVLTTACHAEQLFKSIVIYPELSAAVADCGDVWGFTAQTGKKRAEHIELSVIDAERCASQNKTALVFGPEDTGLRRDHIELCSTLVRIETPGPNPSLNLAHAVTVALFHISSLSKPAIPATEEKGESVSQASMAQLDFLIEEAAYRSGFFAKGTPLHLPGLLKQVTRRIRPSERELQMLLGLFSRVAKGLRGDVPVSDYPPAEDERIGYKPLERKS